jgi:hypothetical protein
MTAVMRPAEARLNASSMIKSSMIASLTDGPTSDCTMYTSCSRAFSLILTKMLSLANFVTSASPSGTSRWAAMSLANLGWAFPV